MLRYVPSLLNSLYTPLGLPVSGEQKRLSTYGAQENEDENEDYYKRQQGTTKTTL